MKIPTQIREHLFTEFFVKRKGNYCQIKIGFEKIYQHYYLLINF